MIHRSRVFRATTVETPEELAEKLTDHAWTLCTAFQCRGLVFANDSFSEDGAQEWVVLRDGKQVESVTFSWCSQEKGLEIILRILAGEGESFGRVDLRTDHPEGYCQLCQ